MAGKLLNCLIRIITNQPEQFLSVGSVAYDPKLGGSSDHYTVLTESVSLSSSDRLRSIQPVTLEPVCRVVATVAECLHPCQAGVLLRAQGSLSDEASCLERSVYLTFPALRSGKDHRKGAAYRLEGLSRHGIPTVECASWSQHGWLECIKLGKIAVA